MKRFLSIITSAIILFAFTPTATAWPLHHRKSAHVSACFVGIDTKPLSSAMVYFVPSNGKNSVVVRTDKDGRISVHLIPSRYAMTVADEKNDFLFSAEYMFSAGNTDLSAVEEIAETYKQAPPRKLGGSK
jgi:hypothetical protein